MNRRRRRGSSSSRALSPFYTHQHAVDTGYDKTYYDTPFLRKAGNWRCRVREKNIAQVIKLRKD